MDCEQTYVEPNSAKLGRAPAADHQSVRLMHCALKGSYPRVMRLSVEGTSRRLECSLERSLPRLYLAYVVPAHHQTDHGCSTKG